MGSLAAAPLFWFILVCVGEFDLIWEFVVELYLRLLSQRILSNCLESLLHIYGFFSARLEVRDVSFTMAPLLGSLGGDSPIFQINFVAYDNKGEILWVSGAGLDEEFVSPAIKGLECVRHCDVIDQYTAVSSSVKRHTQTLKPLLTCRVPYLHCDEPIIHHHFFCEEICSNRCLVLIAEFLINILVHQRSLTNPAVSQNDDF